MNITCTETQSPEHLLLNCQHFKEKQQTLKQSLEKGQVNLRILLNTVKGIKNTLIFLKNTRIATRKWILGDSEIDEREIG